MFSLPVPPARRLMSFALSLIIPRLNSSLGSSVFPARMVSFNFWLCCAISRSRIVAALEPEGVVPEPVAPGKPDIAEALNAVKGCVDCCGVVMG